MVQSPPVEILFRWENKRGELRSIALSIFLRLCLKIEATVEIWSKDQLKYAFAMEMVKQVIEAKEHILEVERTYFFTCFPRELILKLELENPNQRRECFEEAIRQLPKILSFDEKLQIVGMCLGAGLCNDQLGFREFSIIELTATSLEITTEELVTYIAFMLDDSPDAIKALPFFDDDDISVTD